MISQAHSWYALVVKPRHEKASSNGLAVKGFDSFLPLYTSRHRWADRYKDVQLPLFPGYVFCRFDAHARAKVLSTPGLRDVVRVGKDPAAIPDHEIEALQMIMALGLKTEPWNAIEVGQMVEIDNGPLTGVQGRVLKIKTSFRLVVSVSFMCRSVLVEIDQAWVRPAKATNSRLAQLFPPVSSLPADTGLPRAIVPFAAGLPG
jgi:transcription antitermination factor NusG